MSRVHVNPMSTSTPSVWRAIVRTAAWAGIAFALSSRVPSSIAADLLDDELSARVDQRVESQIAEAPLVGVAVAVVYQGEAILLRGYGEARLDHAEPVTPDTRFQIASLTKTFAAAATLLLVRDSVLTLDDPIRKWLPECPPAWPVITIRQLLAQTSGIADYAGFEGIRERYQQDIPRQEILREIFSHELTHPAGEAWAYSNSGYFVLGIVLERASGSSCQDLLERRVFAPLGMHRTLLPSSGMAVDGMAIGYDAGTEGFKPATYNSPSWSFIAGGVLSTARDLARWDAALDGDAFLTVAEKQLLWTPVVPGSGEPAEYGLGWMVKSGPAGRHFAFHRGNKPGFSATMIRDLEDRLTVIVLSNRTEGDSSKLADDIGGFFFRKLLQ